MWGCRLENKTSGSGGIDVGTCRAKQDHLGTRAKHSNRKSRTKAHQTISSPSRERPALSFIYWERPAEHLISTRCPTKSKEIQPKVKQRAYTLPLQSLHSSTWQALNQYLLNQSIEENGQVSTSLFSSIIPSSTTLQGKKKE